MPTKKHTEGANAISGTAVPTRREVLRAIIAKVRAGEYVRDGEILALKRSGFTNWPAGFRFDTVESRLRDAREHLKAPESIGCIGPATVEGESETRFVGAAFEPIMDSMSHGRNDPIEASGLDSDPYDDDFPE